MMTVMQQAWKALPVPWAVEEVDRVPKQRYFDPEFFELERTMFWPRVWQMACRLEEIPSPGDYAEYQILDQSIVVVRDADMNVKAFYNACRHRGVKLVEGHGSSRSGFTCSFHGWCYGLDGANTFVYQRELFDERNLDAGDIGLTPVRCELWGGCAWINMDDDAPPLRDTIEPFATMHDGYKVESLKTDWWLSCRLPVNWKLAMEAFMEGYHVMETHPQLNPPGAKEAIREAYTTVQADGSKRDINEVRTGTASSSREMVDTFIHFMRKLSDGMAGMVHANDVRIAEGLRDTELPDDPNEALGVWRTKLNDAIVDWYQAAGCDVPDLNELDRTGMNEVIGFCFPHYFLLPQYSSASSYRIRPLGPEETLFELWSLARHPEGREQPRPTPPEPMAPDDSRWPEIPGQDFSNLPRQQEGLHANGFEYMRLSDKIEGLISNFQRTLDGYLAGLPSDQLVTAMQKCNTTINVPIDDLDI